MTRHHLLARFLLPIAFFAALAINTQAQHCPFDNAALIAVEVRAHGTDALIPNLRVVLLDSTGHPLRNGNAEYLFWRNPVDSFARTTPDRIGWGREHALFRFAGDRYVRPLGMGMAADRLFVRVEDLDGYAGGGYFESAAVPVEPENITSLCRNNPNDSAAPGFTPIVVELRTNATEIDNGEPDIASFSTTSLRPKQCRCGVHTYCGCSCCPERIIERIDVEESTIDVKEKDAEEVNHEPGGNDWTSCTKAEERSVEKVTELFTPNESSPRYACGPHFVPAGDVVSLSQSFASPSLLRYLIGIYPHADGVDSAIPNLRYTLLDTDGNVVSSDPGPRPFLRFDSDRGVPPGQRSCVRIVRVDTLEDIVTRTFSLQYGSPRYLVVEDVDGWENGGRFRTDTIAIPVEKIYVERCTSDPQGFFVMPIEVVLKRDDKIYDGEVMNPRLLDRNDTRVGCSRSLRLDSVEDSRPADRAELPVEHETVPAAEPLPRSRPGIE